MHNKSVHLARIAEIRHGFQFRKKIEGTTSGAIRVIQMANIVDNRKIDFCSLFFVDEVIKPDHFLQKDDILFCARGSNNYAIIIDEDIAPTVAVSQFHIIKVDNRKIVPAYLAWYFAQGEALLYLKSNTLMSTVPLINKKTLEDMPIPLPSLDLQKVISEIYTLHQKENELIELITSKKTRLINTILQKTLSSREHFDVI